MWLHFMSYSRNLVQAHEVPDFYGSLKTIAPFLYVDRRNNFKPTGIYPRKYMLQILSTQFFRSLVQSSYIFLMF